MMIPTLIVGFVSCALAAYTDIKVRKVPNWLTFSTLAAALCSTAFRGLAAFEIAVVILVVALVGGTLLQSTGVLGGGDVKLLVAISVLVGFPNCIALLLYTALAGGILAILSSALQKRLPALLSSTREVLFVSLAARRVVAPPVRPDAKMSERLPYAIAIGSGFLLLMLSTTIVPALRIL